MEQSTTVPALRTVSVGPDGLTTDGRAVFYGKLGDVLDTVVAAHDDSSSLAGLVRRLLTQDTAVHVAVARLLTEHADRAQEPST